jgi:hypothetical protein
VGAATTVDASTSVTAHKVFIIVVAPPESTRSARA